MYQKRESELFLSIWKENNFFLCLLKKEIFLIETFFFLMRKINGRRKKRSEPKFGISFC
jgi:hypothetical protein